MRLAFFALIPVLALIASSAESPRPRLGKLARISTTRVPLNPRYPLNARIGFLTFLGGMRLTSPDPAFGGFSAMEIAGERLTLVSDTGAFVAFRLGAGWRLRDIRFGDLPDGPGTGLGKGDRDSESLTVDPATGRAWIGFEGSNEIWRYAPGLSHAEAHSAPEAMAEWDVNGGAEAMVRRARGDFIVISETSKLPGVAGVAALHFAGDPTDPRTPVFAFGFRPPPGYSPSDMAELPDGRLLVLTRRISINRWFESALVLVDPADIGPRASVEGRVIAHFTIPVTRDNFEALAVTRERGATMVWIASDDNLTPLQRTLLMKFRLDLPEGD